MSKKKKRKQKKDNASGPASWLTTYSDMMSLLLAFFVLLFSMSVISTEKFEAVNYSMKDAFLGTNGATILEGPSSLDEGVVDEESPFDENKEDITEEVDQIPKEVILMYDQAMDYIDVKGLNTEISLTRDEKGIYLYIQESILFSSGRATLTSSGEDTLESLAGLLKIFDNSLVVEGHTDNVPMSSERFPSNWELSTGRAVSVLRYLSEEEEIDPKRLSAKGYGEFQPLVLNDTQENKAKNRRVNIAVVHEKEEIPDGF
ncbi:flagellar motor protein MotB [Lacticigenium naphthae]|uniref:flagellar motor protein MotB n=1 Tax=Lacticigenium naphthae TaxID=515351 RepID=UPI0004113869|nr:flagellar motor protein MotB [Lacticigenium naphthae]